MNNSFDQVEDFLVDESFRSWVKYPTPELENHWAKFLEENPEKQDLLLQSKKLASQISFSEHVADLEESERILGKIKSETPDWNNQSRRIVWPYWTRVAAILVFAAALGVLSYLFTIERQPAQQIAEVELILKKNPYGVRSQHVLSDGTIVHLNAGSSIEYPKEFNSNKREVVLSGEAYFEVFSDSLRPFSVLSDNFKVTVLGTKFNMVSDAKDDFVALIEGSVQVSTNLKDGMVLLKPGQKADLTAQNDGFEINSFDEQYILGWIEGNLIFNNASFEEVTRRLEKWYGKSIKITNKPAAIDWSYTGIFTNKSLDNVLLNMSSVRDFEYNILKETVTITF